MELASLRFVFTEKNGSKLPVEDPANVHTLVATVTWNDASQCELPPLVSTSQNLPAFSVWPSAVSA
jgi:hypothetical protein